MRFQCLTVSKKEPSPNYSEDYLRSKPKGQSLVDDVYQHGLSIETGYVDSRNGDSQKNFLKSWQELTGERDIEKAIIKLNGVNDEFDSAWKVFDENAPSGNPTYTLMTRSTVSGYRLFEGNKYLNLPRIALTDPAFINGYRRFTLGNGRILTPEENELLMEAYLEPVRS
jgi:hypothetical protein